MAELNNWDIAAANNNDAPPDGWPETTMQYSEVNNTAREGMAVIARHFQDINGTLQFGGTANAKTVTLNAGYTAYFQGMYFAAEVNTTNTGATTIDVNALGAKTVVDQGGNALGAGDLQAGGVYEFRYDGTNFQLMGGDANIVASTLQLRANINTATPPTTEAVIVALDVYDADGTDLLGQMGFPSGSNVMQVRNYMHGGAIVLRGEDNAGATQDMFNGDPDGASGMYHAGTQTARTVAVASGGLEVNQTVTGAGFERAMTVSDNALKANLASPAFTGNPTAPTPTAGDNDTSIATTAFVQGELGSLPTLLMKTADETVTNSTTLQDDDHFTGINLVADKHYFIEGLWIHSGFSNAAFKCLFVFTNTPQNGRYSHIVLDDTIIADQGVSDIDATEVMAIHTGTPEYINKVYGYFQANASTGGTVKLQWAQDSASITGTVFHEGSWLAITQLD